MELLRGVRVQGEGVRRAVPRVVIEVVRLHPDKDALWRLVLHDNRPRMDVLATGGGFSYSPANCTVIMLVEICHWWAALNP